MYIHVHNTCTCIIKRINLIIVITARKVDATYSLGFKPSGLSQDMQRNLNGLRNPAASSDKVSPPGTTVGTLSLSNFLSIVI